MNPLEPVDIVDENGNVLRQTTKADAHAKGLLHSCVIAEVIDPLGNWWMVKQAPHKQDRGQFVSPMGGHVRAGETLEEAMKRETFEELGLKNFKFELKGKAIYFRKVDDHIENHLFVVYEIYTDDQPVLSDEAVELKRFSREELKKTLHESPEMFGDAFHFLVREMYQELI